MSYGQFFELYSFVFYVIFIIIKTRHREKNMSHTHICPICGKTLDDRDKYEIDTCYFDGFAHLKCIRNEEKLYEQGYYDEYGDPDQNDYF